MTINAARGVHTTRTVDEYMALPYRMEVVWEEECWAARFPELPGLIAANETWEGLPRTIEEAKRTWFESMLEDGKPIPKPRRDEEEYSGKLRLRLPKSTHQQAALAAEREGVSLNTFLVAAATAAVDSSRSALRPYVEDRLGHRLSSGDWTVTLESALLAMDAKTSEIVDRIVRVRKPVEAQIRQVR